MLKPLSTLIAAALLLGAPTMPADAASKGKPAAAAVKKPAAPAKAKAKLGWEPTTSFEQLIRLMVDADLELLSR